MLFCFVLYRHKVEKNRKATKYFHKKQLLDLDVDVKFILMSISNAEHIIRFCDRVITRRYAAGCLVIWNLMRAITLQEALGPSQNMSVFPRHYLLTYLLTYSMVQNPSWEANWSAASQETPRILRNPKVHYRTHKRPPPVSILGQPNPVHIPTSHFLEIRSNIIRPSTPRSPQWSPSLRFPQQDPIHPPSPHPYALVSPPLSLLFHFPENNFVTYCVLLINMLDPLVFVA